jgi:hypothetical protein
MQSSVPHGVFSRAAQQPDRAGAYLCLVLLTALLSAPLAARAVPFVSEETFLAGSTGSSLEIIRDGVSNTIIFTQETVLDLCLRRVAPLPGIVDGASNTIIIGETAREDLCFANFFDVSNWQDVFSSIVDGASNTLLIGEDQPIAFDGRSWVDVCATNVNLSIRDGASNTIVFAESVCFNNVRIATQAVREPPVGLAFLGLLLLTLLRYPVRTATRLRAGRAARALPYIAVRSSRPSASSANAAR